MRICHIAVKSVALIFAMTLNIVVINCYVAHLYTQTHKDTYDIWYLMHFDIGLVKKYVRHMSINEIFGDYGQFWLPLVINIEKLLTFKILFYETKN